MNRTTILGAAFLTFAVPAQNETRTPQADRAEPLVATQRHALTMRVAQWRQDAIVLEVEGAPPAGELLVFHGTRRTPRRQALEVIASFDLAMAEPRLIQVTRANALGSARVRWPRSAELDPALAVAQVVAIDGSEPGRPVASHLVPLTAPTARAVPGVIGAVAPRDHEAPRRIDRLRTILDVPGVRRWYDPELSTFSGDTWQDLTGNADLRQPSVSARPTWNPTGLHGKPSLGFDGSNDHLFNTSPLLANLDEFTLILIAKAERGQIDKRVVAEGSSQTNVPLFVPIRTGSNTRTSSPSQLIRNDANNLLFEDSSGPLVFDGDVHFFGVSVDRTAGTVTNFEDIEFDEPDAYPATGTFSVDRFTLGAMIRTIVQFHFAGEIGPLIVVDRALSVGEVGQIREYYERRGYLDRYRQQQPTSAVPPGYTLVYDEDFSGYSSAADVVEDGQVPSTGKPFADSFVTFGVRHLVGNNDRCYKGLAGDTGAGSTPLATLIGTEPHELVDDTLRLRFGEIPPARRAEFQNREHGGGMISTERSFAHGPGLYEVRMRVRNLPPGGHFALWLLTQNTSPHEVEIDLVEVIGNNLISKDKPLNALFYNGHDRQNVPQRNGPQTTEEVSNYQLNQWHTYSFLYTPTRFTWYRDGVVVRDEPAYFDGSSPLYFLATWESNFSTPKNFPGPSLGNGATLPAEVEIDYLRVYAPPAEGPSSH